MTFNHYIRLVWLGFVLVLVGCGGQPAAIAPTALPSAPVSASAPTRQIVLGEISEKPTDTLEAFQPLVDYMTANLGVANVKVTIKAAPDLDTMAQWMKSGEVDLFFDSPYPAMIVSDKSGAQPILRRWKGGVAEYHTVFFARKQDGLTSLDQLQGHMLGFEERFSTSGYFLPATHLISAGLHPFEKGKLDDTVARDEIGYVFTTDNENTVQLVLGGKLAAGAVDQITFEKIGAEARSTLTILDETAKVARHVVLASATMDNDLVDAVKRLLVTMDTTDAGRSTLMEFEKTAKFDTFPTDADLARMRDLYTLLQGK